MVKIQIGVRLVSLSRRNLLMVSSVSMRGEVWAARWEPVGNYLPGAEGQIGMERAVRVASSVSLQFHSTVCGRFGSSLEGICLHSWVCHQEPNVLYRLVQLQPHCLFGSCDQARALQECEAQGFSQTVGLNLLEKHSVLEFWGGRAWLGFQQGFQSLFRWPEGVVQSAWSAVVFGFWSLITLGGGGVEGGALNRELEDVGSTSSLAVYQL